MSHYSVTEVSTRFYVKLFFLLLRTSPDSLRYFWPPTRRLIGTKREFATNAMLAAGLSGFYPHRLLQFPLQKHNHDKRW